MTTLHDHPDIRSAELTGYPVGTPHTTEAGEEFAAAALYERYVASLLDDKFWTVQTLEGVADLYERVGKVQDKLISASTSNEHPQVREAFDAAHRLINLLRPLAVQCSLAVKAAKSE